MFKLSSKNNISSIETFLFTLLQGKVSNNTIARTLPNTINKEWDDMVVIDCENPILDYDAYSLGTIYIHLYSRPLKNGLMNVAKMKELEDKLDDAIMNNTDKTYRLEKLSTQGDFDTNIKWHRNIVELIIKIII